MAEHPLLAGRADELVDLAAAVRRLVQLCTSSVAPAALTAQAARELHAVADRLADHVPDPPLSVTMAGLDVAPPGMTARMPFDVVVGSCNPIALPLVDSLDSTNAELRGTFGRQYEGPPECVHGAVIAGAFDIALTAANFKAGVAGPTARLSLRYLRPTRLDEECVFEAWVAEHDGRRVTTRGRLRQGETTTVEAEGVFVALDREVTLRLHERGRPAPG